MPSWRYDDDGDVVLDEEFGFERLMMDSLMCHGSTSGPFSDHAPYQHKHVAWVSIHGQVGRWLGIAGNPLAGCQLLCWLQVANLATSLHAWVANLLTCSHAGLIFTASPLAASAPAVEANVLAGSQ